MSDTNIEQRITNAVAENIGTGPRITEERVEGIIVGEQYACFHDTTTVCVLQLVNGFTVVGSSACVAPENYDERYGRELARIDAKNKIWQLEGYLLKQWLMLEDMFVAEPEPSRILVPSL
jgi:hypothetical protein